MNQQENAQREPIETLSEALQYLKSQPALYKSSLQRFWEMQQRVQVEEYNNSDQDEKPVGLTDRVRSLFQQVENKLVEILARNPTIASYASAIHHENLGCECSDW